MNIKQRALKLRSFLTNNESAKNEYSGLNSSSNESPVSILTHILNDEHEWLRSRGVQSEKFVSDLEKYFGGVV